MKRKLVTPTADAALEDVFDYIRAENPAAAKQYLEAALDAFYGLPDFRVPVRASDHLPDYVRSLNISGYSGYTLRIAVFEDVVYLLTALRPGAMEAMNDARTRAGLRDL